MSLLLLWCDATLPDLGPRARAPSPRLRRRFCRRQDLRARPCSHATLADERALPGAAQEAEAPATARADHAKDKNPACEAARRLSQATQQVRQEEAADAACRADDAGDDANLPGEALRHELEDGTIAHAEQPHCHE